MQQIMGSFSFFLLLSFGLLSQGRHIRGEQGDQDTSLHTSSDYHFNTLMVTYLKINPANQSEASLNRTKRCVFFLAVCSLNTLSTLHPLC